MIDFDSLNGRASRHGEDETPVRTDKTPYALLCDLRGKAARH